MIKKLKPFATYLLDGAIEVFARIEEPCTLAIVTVGDSPASLTYVKNKIAKCETIPNVKHHWIQLVAETKQEALNNLLDTLSKDKAIHGILLQQPLPEHLNALEALTHIDPIKDVDGLTLRNKRFLYTGTPEQSITPCTALGVLLYLDAYFEHGIVGKTVLVIGRSDLVGRPLAHAIEECNATLLWANSHTPPDTLVLLAQQADIIISAVGVPGLINKKHVNACKHQLFIDVGISYDANNKIIGDCDLNALAMVDLCDVTAVPGGVGQLTTTALFYNLYKCYEWQITHNKTLS